MNPVIKIILIYLLLVNVGGLLAFFIDKKRSQRAKWRIPEATLFSFAFFGGGPGCLLEMYWFRHKTLKPYFTIGIPTIIIVEVLLVVILLFFSPLSFMIL